MILMPSPLLIRGVYSSRTLDSFPHPPSKALILFPLQKLEVREGNGIEGKGRIGKRAI